MRCGRRIDRLVLDDVYDEQNTLSPAQAKALAEFMRQHHLGRLARLRRQPWRLLVCVLRGHRDTVMYMVGTGSAASGGGSWAWRTCGHCGLHVGTLPPGVSPQ